jgi:transitional endoplasmic reticulum ATPase
MILQKKQTPNALLVDDSTTDDHSTIALHPDKMEELKLFTGDIVLLKGKKRKSTIAVVVSDENVDVSKVQMTKVVRSNLR